MSNMSERDKIRALVKFVETKLKYSGIDNSYQRREWDALVQQACWGSCQPKFDELELCWPCARKPIWSQGERCQPR